MLFVSLHGNRRTWVGCGRPGVPAGCAFKWPVWGVPLNDDDDDDSYAYDLQLRTWTNNTSAI